MPGATRRRRHRSRRRLTLLGSTGALVAAAILVPAAVAGGWALRPRHCESTVTVQVATTAGFVPVLQGAADDLTRPDSQRRCVAVRTRLRGEADLGAELGRRAGIGLGLDLPDVWVPDSTLWLSLARRSGSGSARVAAVSASLATSPVVVAMQRQAASEQRWPRVQPDWRVPRGGQSPALGDPRYCSASLAALLAVRSGSAGDPAAAVAGFASRVVVPRLPGGSPSAALGRDGVGAIPTSEQDVVLHNRRFPGRPVVAVYDGSLASRLDFPFVRIASGRPDAAPRWAVTALERALRNDPALDAARAAGLRGPNGAALPAGTAGALPVSRPAAATPKDAAVLDTLASWRTLGRRSRALLVLQTSSSMGERVAGAGQSRLALAQQAMAAAVRTSPPDADLGLWTFTAAPAGQPDHAVRVPVGPLFDLLGGRSRQAALLTAVRDATPDPDGGSALYGTVLAGFREMARGFVYGRLNTVVVFTDGTDADPGGLGLDRLLNTLRREYDGVMPVRVITVAYGAADESPALIRVSDVTGGRSYRAVTAAEVPELIREALSEL